MDWDSIAIIAAAALSVLAAWLQGRGRGSRRRQQLKSDLEVLRELPEESDARRALLEHVEAGVRALVRDESERRRDPFGMSLAALFLAVAAVLLWFAVQRGGPWWWLLIPIAFFGIFGLVGFVESASRRLRDERGKALDRTSSRERREEQAEPPEQA